MIRTPDPHPSGEPIPELPRALIPSHVAIVMDGNGRWANQRMLPRTAGHAAGEAALLDVMAGAIELGIKHVSVYAFSTENWSRSPEEVRFLMGFSRDVLRRQRDTLNSWGVRIVWSGRRGRLWKSVIKELEDAQKLTQENSVCTLNMCVNYGGRAEILDAVNEAISASSRARPKLTEKQLAKQLYNPDLPDIDLLLRTSGEQRTSNFQLWRAAYSEMLFLDELWPDVDRRTLYKAVTEYARRDRRYGAAVDTVSNSTHTETSDS